MKHLPGEVLKRKHLGFLTPKETVAYANYQQESLSFTHPVSWADEERDLSAWLENDLQKNAIETLYALLERVKQKDNEYLLNQRLVMLLSDKNKVLPEFLHLLSKMELFQGNFFLNATGTANQANVSIADVSEIEIPIPPLEEQIKIILLVKLEV
jgi:hypothetical protein